MPPRSMVMLVAVLAGLPGAGAFSVVGGPSVARRSLIRLPHSGIGSSRRSSRRRSGTPHASAAVAAVAAPSVSRLSAGTPRDEAADPAPTTSGPRKKRTRRKATTAAADRAPPAPAAAARAPEQILPGRTESAVSLPVVDVREFINGGQPPAAGKNPAATTTTPSRVGPNRSFENVRTFADDEDEDEEDVEDDDDPLARLLVDAEEMRATQRDAGMTKPEEGGVTGTIKKVLSTIVTVDFFFVCALFLWFLAGIFCSYILKVRRARSGGPPPPAMGARRVRARTRLFFFCDWLISCVILSPPLCLIVGRHGANCLQRHLSSHCAAGARPADDCLHFRCRAQRRRGPIGRTPSLFFLTSVWRPSAELIVRVRGTYAL